MRARRGLIPSSFLVLLLSLILVSCSGGGSEAPQSVTAPPGPPQPPAPVGLLWYTPTGIFRSQTDGTDRRTLVHDVPLVQVMAHLAESVVLYRTRPDVPGGSLGWPNTIWKVHVTGTGNQALVETQINLEFLIDAIGSWVIYGVFLFCCGPHSVALDGSAIHELRLLPNLFYEASTEGRVVMLQRDDALDTDLYSELPDGTDLRHLATLPTGPVPQGPPSGSRYVGISAFMGTQVIYGVLSETGVPDLFAVPVTGGPVTTVVEGPDYKWVSAVVGSRVVYRRCAIIGVNAFGQIAGPCDLYSVHSDGSGTVALSTHPDNDTVQGVVGSQVVVRRSHGGPTDTLVSIPVVGGTETPILTLSFSDEFVMAIIDGRIIVQRPTGLWSVQADGTGLVQLTTQDHDFEFVRGAGPFACVNRGEALWCVPADGSGPATKVTDQGQFVAGL